MNLCTYLFLVFILIDSVSSDFHVNTTMKEECPNEKRSVVSVRKRRHLVFPKGSAASLVLSAVKTIMTHAPSGWFSVLEVELVYLLPDPEVVIAHNRKKLHHRQKKEIWESIQNVLELRNMNGRACIIRTICEARMQLAPKGRSLVHDILRAMFSAPLQEREFVDEMGLKYSELLKPDFCMQPNDCPFSILDFLLELNKMR